MPENEFIVANGHPLLLILRQIENDKKPRRLGGYAQQVVIPGRQPKSERAIPRSAQIYGGLQLEVECRPHRPSRLNTQVNAIPVQVIDGGDVASPGCHRMSVGHG